MDMVLSSPLQSAFIYFSIASAIPRFLENCFFITIAAMVSKAKYGFTAVAPYPRRSAMCMTSLASPVSTMIPELVRTPAITNLLFTAETAKRAGIGAWFSGKFRSDRIINVIPLAIAFSALSHISEIAFSRACPSPLAGNPMGMLTLRNPLILSSRIRFRSSLASTGCCSLIKRLFCGISDKIFPGLPIKVIKDMTNSSRTGSMGGLVTWAKSCLK